MKEGGEMRKLSVSFLIVLSVVFFVASFAYAHRNSSPNSECYSCHSGANVPAFITVKGLPDKYVPGGIYNVTVTVKSENASISEVQGGFSVKTDGGELGVTDMKNTQFSYPYLTHTVEGAASRSWSFAWRAPSQQMTAEIHIMAVAANGDYSPAGDAATGAVFTIEPQ
jgi:hypothetical protein